MREDYRYNTLNSTWNSDGDDEEDRYGEMAPDWCVSCGKEMGEDEVSVKYDAKMENSIV